MASDDKSKVTVDSILAKLSPEEKKVIEQAQRTVEARAKKKSVQRRLDDDDRKCIRECLKKAGCKDKKLYRQSVEEELIRQRILTSYC